MKTNVKIILLTTLLISPVSLAATGEITANPHHLVIDIGQTGTTTVSWQVTGASTGQVWVSTDGGPETFLTEGQSGTVDVDWIEPEKIHVFKLYEGTAHSNLLAWMSVTSHKPPSVNFGFVYWPHKQTCQTLSDDEWTDERKQEIKTDLDIMASFGGRLFRVMFWPQFSGYKLYTDGSGGYFTTDYDEIKINLIELLSFYYERDLKVYIAFGNNYHRSKDPSSGLHWWQIAYGDDFNAFLQDTYTWMNGIIEAVESSEYASTVIFYNLETETADVVLNNWDYWRYIYDNCSVPRGKYCLNPLRTNVDTPIAKAELGDRRFDYIEFHCYPDIATGNNKVPQIAYDEVKAYYPDSTAVLGEYGGMGPDPLDLYTTTIEPSTEQTQQTTEVNVVDWAYSADLPYFLHWMLWDRTPDVDNQIAGWGYEHHEPKDVMGKMAEMLSIVPNGDMEQLDGIQPNRWSADGTVPVSFSYNTAPATNILCGRLMVLQTSGSAWIQSDKVSVRGGRMLFLNSFIRTSMDNVYMGVREYDESQNLIHTSIGPKIASADWQWYNYLHATMPWHVNLEPQTRFIEVVIGGDVRNNPSLLDVDTVSVWENNLETVKADFNRDRKVDNYDFENFAKKWLVGSDGADWDPKYNIDPFADDIIDAYDLAELGKRWLWQ